MSNEKYDFETDPTASIYEFESVGKRGIFKKQIAYVLIESSNIYNLSFVDIDRVSGVMSDTVVSDNGDTQKVLATVASTVLDFTDRYTDVWVFAKGSTPARTRLYQIGITTNLELITSNFEVFGLTKNGWKEFEIGTNFEAFLVKRK